MSDDRRPPPPRKLGRRGKALWRDLHERLEYDAHEAAIVLEACRTVDRIDELQDVISRDGVTSAGSMGQTVVHPAVPELRQQQAGLTRLLTALNLGAALEGAAGGVPLSRAISAQASRAARARWEKSKGVRGA